MLGLQQGLALCNFWRHLSKDHLYFCIKYEINITEHLEIPAAQCTKTLVFLRFYSINSNAGLKTWLTFWSWESFKSNVMLKNFYGYLWCKFTPDTIALMLFFSSFETLWAKEKPLIHISPIYPSLSMTFCPSL
jgi:hypothetical protein